MNPLFASSSGPKPASGPKVLFGNSEIRKRIDVRLENLEGNPKYKPAALDIILTSNLEKLDYQRVLEFGGDVQRKHQEILQSLFNLFNCPEVQSIKDSLNDVVAALRPQGFLGRFIQREPNIVPLNLGKPKLYQFKDKCAQIRAELINLSEALEPLVIACLFFSKYNKEGFPNDLFIARADSLITTQATIKTNLQQEEVFSQNVNQLIDSVNQVILNEYPLWQTNRLTNRNS